MNNTDRFDSARLNAMVDVATALPQEGTVPHAARPRRLVALGAPALAAMLALFFLLPGNTPTAGAQMSDLDDYLNYEQVDDLA